MGAATVGKPRGVWESKIQGFCGYKLLGAWLDLASVWIDTTDDYVGFCFPRIVYFILSVCFCRCGRDALQQMQGHVFFLPSCHSKKQVPRTYPAMMET